MKTSAALEVPASRHRKQDVPLRGAPSDADESVHPCSVRCFIGERARSGSPAENHGSSRVVNTTPGSIPRSARRVNLVHVRHAAAGEMCIRDSNQAREPRQNNRQHAPTSFQPSVYARWRAEAPTPARQPLRSDEDRTTLRPSVSQRLRHILPRARRERKSHAHRHQHAEHDKHLSRHR